MVKRLKAGSLTPFEKKIAKSLLAKNWRNQDIQDLINQGRENTINSARITEVKQDENQKAATKEETDFYIKKKASCDPQTGLNFYDDERLIRAREAMILAVQVFNSAGLKFKTEVFAVLANIAWTYLLHEFYERKGKGIINKDGRSLLLSQMIEKSDCPISNAMKQNLRAIKTIRDDVEHQLLGKADFQWQSLFQACCLNFNKVMVEQFGEKLSLANELSFALQFSKMDIEQLSTLNKYEIPQHIKTIDAGLSHSMTEEQLNDIEYQFSVTFTLSSASKSRSKFQFVSPESAEGQDIQNVLLKYKPLDELYPFKPSQVCKEVTQKSGRKLTQHMHTKAWKYYRVRPQNKAPQPGNTDKDYCTYHAAHQDYTFSQRWIDKLCKAIIDSVEIEKIRNF